VIGAVIGGKYRLGRELGKGGMGAVYEATHVGTGRRVAVKLMKVSRDDDDATKGQIARFQREAIAVGRLETQHVVQVYDAGTDEGTKLPYLAMELLEGEDVSQLIRRIGPLRQDLALAIVTQACAGIQKAHDAGVIHRDIKPSNMFLARNEYGEYTLKVLDFGIAKVKKSDAVHDAGGTITETGTLVGSPHYMSPEQAKGLKTIDHRSDLWSLGVVLHKCLSGRTPFDGYSTLGQVIVAVCSEDPISVQEHAPWVRPELSIVLRQSLKRDPNLRYQSAMQLLEALRAFLPAGPRITEDMVVPLSEQEMGQVMPRRSEFPTQVTPPSQTSPMTSASSGAWLASASGPSSTPSGAFAPSGTPLPALPSSSSAIRAGAPSSPSMSTKFATTQDAHDVEFAPPAKKRLIVPITALAVVAMAAAAFFAVPKIRAMTLDRPAAAAPTPPVESSTAAAPAVAPTAPAVATTKAKIAVTPANATVEIDGTAAHVEAGFVTIEGSAGSVHKVKVAQGGRDTVVDVVLTDKGPLPAKVALDTSKQAAAPPAAKPGAAPPPIPAAKPTAAAAPASKPAAAPAKTAGTFDRNFE
jgi:eukaryotic-like serine/threonine-protein kinase